MKYKFLFADLDDTLITTMSGHTFPQGVWDMVLKIDVLEAIKAMKPEVLMIVSNQGGISAGHVNKHFFDSKIRYICNAIEEYTGVKTGNIYCTSNDEQDKLRKPNTGMLDACQDAVLNTDNQKYDKSEMLMIGDASGKEGNFNDSDKKTAENFGIDYIDVRDLLAVHSQVMTSDSVKATTEFSDRFNDIVAECIELHMS